MPASAKLAAFTSRVSKKFTDLTYKDTKFPSGSRSTLESFLKNSNAQTAPANEHRVNVAPDFTPAFLFLLNDAIEQRQHFEKFQDPKGSFYLYLAFNLNLIYTWFLIHDLYISPGHEYYAESLIENDSFVQYLEKCLEYPVPYAVTEVLASWTTSNHASQPHVWYCPSLGHAMLHTHFAKYFPVSILFAAHDLVADSNANTTLPELTYEYAISPVFTVLNHVANYTATPAVEKFTFLVHNFFALIFPHDPTTAPASPRETSTYLNSKHNQILHAFLNFDSIKSMKAKTRFTATGIVPPVFTNDFFNPYVLATCATKTNIHELTLVYDTIANIIIESGLSNTNLAKSFTDLGSSGILNHGYSTFPLPSWDAKGYVNSSTRDDSFFQYSNKYVKVTRTELDTYADTIRFKVDTTQATFTPVNLRLLQLGISPALRPPTVVTNLTQVNVTFALTRSAQSSLPFTVPDVNGTFDFLNSINQQTIDYPDWTTTPPTATAPDFTTRPAATGPLRTYESTHDVYPKVKVYGPHALTETNAPYVTLRGMIIYSDELTATIVTHLQSQDDIQDDNTEFLQSAIPMAFTHHATSFRSVDPVASHITMINQKIVKYQHALTMIRSCNKVFAPRPSGRYYHFGTDYTAPGLHVPANDQDLPVYNQTVISQDVATIVPRARDNRQSLPNNTPAGHLLCWSPYTFRRNDLILDDDLLAETNAATLTAQLKLYFEYTNYLTNLRSNFGSSGKVFVVNSPISSMPSTR